MDTNQVKNASRMILIFNTLGKEQKPFSGLACVRHIVVSIWFLCTKVFGKLLWLYWLITEPEEFLREH